MRPSPSAATPPASSPALASPKSKSGATKRHRKADAAPVPLGDVTNLLLPETPTPIKPRRSARRPFPSPSDASAASSTCSSSASVSPAAIAPSPAASVTPAPKPPSAAPVTPAPKPSSAATVTPAPKPSSAAVFEEEGSALQSPTISTVYARRAPTEAQGRRRNPTTTNNKGKEPVSAAGTASCPSLGKSTRNIRKKDTRPISSSAPCHEAKKKRPLASTPKLPEDFVKKQRAYFADIDAFELAEEEVSESELE